MDSLQKGLKNENKSSVYFDLLQVVINGRTLSFTYPNINLPTSISHTLLTKAPVANTTCKKTLKMYLDLHSARGLTHCNSHCFTR
jgi:hypothetical protein